MGDVIQNLFKHDEKQIEQIEESVLFAAHDLARVNSTQSVAVGDILGRSQVSRNTFHKLFNSVEGLYKKLGQKLTNEAFTHYRSQLPVTPDVARRVANKTRTGLQVISAAPFFCKLALRAEWPSLDPKHLMYRDIEKDIREGIEKGCFSDIPPSVGVSIVVGCLRGAARDYLGAKQPAGYINQAVFQVLVGLGLDQVSAAEISKSSTAELPPPPPPQGLAAQAISLQEPPKI